MLKREFNQDIEFADQQHVGYGFIGVVLRVFLMSFFPSFAYVFMYVRWRSLLKSCCFTVVTYVNLVFYMKAKISCSVLFLFAQRNTKCVVVFRFPIKFFFRVIFMMMSAVSFLVIQSPSCHLTGYYELFSFNYWKTVMRVQRIWK